MSEVAKLIKRARGVSTPLIAVTTPDQTATIDLLMSSFNGTAPPVVCWDCIRGLRGMNDKGNAAVAKIVTKTDIPGLDIVPGANPVEALTMATRLPATCILFFMNAQRFLDNAGTIQAIANLRDSYKEDQKTLIMLGPDITLPPELVQDVMIIDEPLPDETQIEEIVKRVHKDASSQIKGMVALDEVTLKGAVAALAGLAAFPAEQACSISVREKKLNIDSMWDRKRGTVNQTSGIQMLEDSTLPNFDDIGGIDAAKIFGSSLFKGASPPRCIVWLDEIEKMLAGLGSQGVGDSSGVSQDQLGVMLREQEFNNWAGLIAVGPPGAGKSHFARALGRTHGVPTITLDLGAMKGSLVGQSEQQIRAALKVVKAVAGKGGAFFVATCNKLTVLPPELRRRYKYGIWYFDLPDAAERELIWKVCLEQFGLKDDKAVRTFDDSGWTGAEIRNVCELAWRLNQSLDDARQNIVPVSVSDSEVIESLRKAADSKFLSANYKGTYQREKTGKPKTGKRVFSYEA